MASWESDDEVDEALSAVRAHDAGPERAERIRSRCLSALSARRRGTGVRERRSGSPAWTAWLEPALALGLGALFLADAVIRALAVYR
jgi:hypothetical protein